MSIESNYQMKVPAVLKGFKLFFPSLLFAAFFHQAHDGNNSEDYQLGV